jgi:hypothetical protein
MKTGDKLICLNNDILIKDEIYYFDHVSVLEEEYYVKDKEGFLCWAPKNYFMSLKQERKEKLKKIKNERW